MDRTPARASSRSAGAAVELSPSDSFAHYYLGGYNLRHSITYSAIQELEISRVPLPSGHGFLHPSRDWVHRVRAS